jgi:predicted nicotinamide N-methyase
MGEITRRWPFKNPDFELVIREPPLVGDSLGLKTWGSSYRLAKMLPELGQRHLAPSLVPNGHVDILELGSGTGLLGLAAAVIWKANVVLTDLPVIMENLEFNAKANQQIVYSLGGKISTAVFQWGGPDETVDARFRQQHQYSVSFVGFPRRYCRLLMSSKIVIVADPLYDDNHPRLLAETIREQLILDNNARALIMVPERDQTTKELRDIFLVEMSNSRHPLACLVEGRLTGQDDWGSSQEEGAVECWWAVFGRTTARVALPV